MQRRGFLSWAAIGAVSPLVKPWAVDAIASSSQGPTIRWTRSRSQGLFNQVHCEGRALVSHHKIGLLDGKCRLVNQGKPTGSTLALTEKQTAGWLGAVKVSMTHQLHDAGFNSGEDLLEAKVTLHNTGDQAVTVEAGFTSAVQPAGYDGTSEVYVPLSASGINRDPRFTPLGSQEFLTDCRQRIGESDFECHYLEPMASYPDQYTTRALLLAPVVDVSYADCPWHVGFFTPSDQPMRFRSPIPADHGVAVWEAGRCVTISPGETVVQKGFLHLHRGNASVAWQAFHRFGHQEDYPVPDWVHDFRVHYYDYLSAAGGENKPRGGGYDEELPHFRTFHVGLATQHGYYPCLGDYLHPDRKVWQAMQSDPLGAATMSLAVMRERIKATRAQGIRAGVYIHPVILDQAVPCFDSLRDAILVDKTGTQVNFDWKGPDVISQLWRASLRAPQWQEHLCQQTQWIMELLDPDAVIVDESFAGLGYDHHPDRAGPMSAASIDTFRRMRSIVKSFGSERAIFSSDCAKTGFVMWADGEAGDHAYHKLLGQTIYHQQPVRYLAALGEKPWRSCAWHFRGMWNEQMKLARSTGAGVGVSNGWLEYTGLSRIPAASWREMIHDIESLINDAAGSQNRE